MLAWIFGILCVLFAYSVYDAIWKNEYWRKKGVPGPLLYPVVGRFLEQAMHGQAVFDQKWIAKLGKVFGIFDGITPTLIVADTEMLKNILVKDFSHFTNRREIEGLNGPILEQAVSVLKDQHWKDVRGVLVPTFTSGKLRHMNPLIHDCCQTLVKNMETLAENETEFEAKELYGRVAMDVIASTFFGMKIDSQNDVNNEFVKHAKKAFDFNFMSPLFIIVFFFPKLVPYFVRAGFDFLVDRKIIAFFVRNTEQIVKLRTSSQDQSRKDFLQLMLNSLKGHSKTSAKDATETVVRHDPNAETADVLSDAISNSAEPNYASNYKLTTEELVAQSVSFFLAGYDTTATALSFLTYCLTVNPDIQERLRDEIDQVMGDKEVATYELIAQMQYLDCCINEALRMYPPVVRTERMCNETWTYKGMTIEKGAIVAVPIFAIQHDPENWPDPETYDPDRFSPENKHKIKPYTFETFGQGPRNCVGMRFAYYEMKLVMVSVMRKYRFVPSSKTEIPLQLKDASFLRAKNGIWIKVEQL